MAGGTTTAATPAKLVLVEEPGAIRSPKLDGTGLHVGLVYTRHSSEIVDPLVMACRGELLLKGVGRENIHELEVMMPYNIPYAMKCMMESAPVKLDVVVCVGCLVRGSLAYEFVAEAVTRASMKIGMKMKTPVVYGVLICTDEQQARHCAGLTEGKTRTCNYGVEWAQSAIDMAHLNRKGTEKMVELCRCNCHEHSGKSKQSHKHAQTKQQGHKENEKQEHHKTDLSMLHPTEQQSLGESAFTDTGSSKSSGGSAESFAEPVSGAFSHGGKQCSSSGHGSHGGQHLK
ncbi:hypothetical protein Poli38472_011805 [Pythium oligandrum]|uniref:6,7-dimethyl-8-ribityllumazine synthase n=1 Tax=Pythium oligandrum TaxID=41045 RepID=A0A8K1FG10_PYTOL|nr:hypothetical protein Poli38472_011805 [Pythium oligandrum]|eukprot:TMW58217.1 hypothetical protein Poli38472_011805 [Pythium oligandrum]